MGLRARANFHELSYLQARALRFNSVMALRISSLRIGIQFAPLRQLLGSLSRVAVFLGIDASPDCLPFSNRGIRGFRWVGYGG